jgi:hypothetical protein
MDSQTDATELVRAFNAHLEKMQRLVLEYLPPDSGITAREALSELIAMLDGPEQSKLQRAAKKFLGERSALFSSGQINSK